MSSSPNLLSSSNGRAAIEWLADVPCPVDAVLTGTSSTVAECSRLAIGSVVRLKQSAGSNLEVRVGGVPFATGEVVATDYGLSIRINGIVQPTPESYA